MTRFGTGWVAFSSVLLLLPGCLGCPEEDLISMKPQIYVDACRTNGVLDCQVGFGRVGIGGTEALRVDVANTGEADLQLTQVFIADSTGGSFSIVGAVPSVIPAGEGNVATIHLRYAPATASVLQGTLRIESNATNVPNDSHTIEVVLEGTGWDMREPHLTLNPRACDFGDVRVGEVRSCEVVAVNDGSLELSLNEAALVPGVDPAFSLQGSGGLPVVLQPRSSVPLLVQFMPGTVGEFTGELYFKSTDPLQPRLDIPLTGNGCEAPTAVASVATINNVPAEGSSVTARPLDDVIVTGIDSTVATPGRTITSYLWEITSKPQGSTITLTRPTGVNTGFQFSSSNINRHGLDVVGLYEVRLVVKDSAGWTSTNDAWVRIDAIPTEDLHVQLTWEDGSSDVDLHLLQGTTATTFGEEDCYYGNCKAQNGLNWGGGAKNPHLDVDDTSGFGPENININGPGAGTYTVGVHFYDGHGVMQTVATVMIYVRGVLMGEFRKTLDCEQPTWWTVAQVQWDAQVTILPVDQLSENRHGVCGM